MLLIIPWKASKSGQNIQVKGLKAAHSQSTWVKPPPVAKLTSSATLFIIAIVAASSGGTIPILSLFSATTRSLTIVKKLPAYRLTALT